MDGPPYRMDSVGTYKFSGYYMRSRKTGKWLRGAKYWPWTRFRMLAAGHATPGVMELLMEKYADQDPEILHFEETTRITRHEARPQSLKNPQAGTKTACALS